MTKPKMWAYKEVSTRNCVSLLENRGFVVCEHGVEMVDAVGSKLKTDRVQNRGQLYVCCVGCPNFDNTWDW